MRKASAALFAAFLAFSGSVSTTGGVALESEAQASVSITLSVDELVQASNAVVVATALERRSQWEDLPSGRRIVTYTRMSIDETVAGDLSRSEVWVRTLGGKVGNIGQQVSGEADLALQTRSLLFLADADDGNGRSITVVTGAAQGHYPIDESGKEPILKASPDAGTLLHRRGPTLSAAEVLVGKKLDEGRGAVRDASQRFEADTKRKVEADQKRKK